VLYRVVRTPNYASTRANILCSGFAWYTLAMGYGPEDVAAAREAAVRALTVQADTLTPDARRTLTAKLQAKGLL
jgi:hypothetical protein